MNTRTHAKKTILGLSIASALLLSSPTQAAPGPLPKTPLFLSNAVEPNVFFLLDDSGSMDWEVMYPDGTAGISSTGGMPILNAQNVAYWHPGWHGDYMYNGWIEVIPPANWSDPDPAVTWEDNIWVLRNHNANRLYYNPSVTYTPWKGTDISGNPLYTDANPTAVLRDPTDPSGDTVDLTQTYDWWDFAAGTMRSNVTYLPSYYTWDADTDGDGEIDANEPHTLYEIKPSTTSYPSGRSYTEELQNFANWFQYYRKREFATKAAIGGVINNTDSTRMGLRVINNGQIQDILTMTDPDNKRGFLQTFYNTPSQHAGTPLRRGLDRVGEYFMETGADAPILPADEGGECQQNFALVMTDGFWNGGTPSGIGNADGDVDSDWDGNQTQSSDGGNYADSFSVTLADVAMHYYETDLRGLDDRVPTIEGVDENNQQHLVTYTISFGLSGTLDPETADPTASGFSWPDPMPSSNDLQKVDDLFHAAYNGRGLYLSAQDPVELETSLNAALTDIAKRTLTAAAVAVNSTRLTTDSVVYLVEFNSNRWQGYLQAFPIIEEVDPLDPEKSKAKLADTPTWEANDRLTNRDLSTNPRQILTWNGSKGTALEWDSNNLTPEMMDDLRTNPDGSTSADAVAQARLEYLRGDRSNENSGYAFRPRQSLLGDIVNSGPVYVGEPSLRWPDTSPFPSSSGSRYSDFKNGSTKNRTKVIYVGSNDGMLHAFSDSTGDELFAYMPSLLASSDSEEGYHYLTDPDYTHNWYVDLTPTVSDVFMTTVNGTNGWHTILVGGLRGGGRGLFALDVTNPSNFTEADADKVVMWEFSSADDNDLGYTYSQPTIALANNGRWVAIFGNGYNDNGDGEAKLFILDIEAGQDGWQPGDYIEITTKAGSTSDRNGLATPALADVDGNGTVDRVYAGDLEGNMWAFDLSSNSSASWDVAYSGGGNPEPLFTTPANQPITAKPVLAYHPSIPDSTSPSNAPNLMVYFGTGQYLVESDRVNTATQSFYGVWDRGDKNLDISNLVEQTFDSSYAQRVLSRNFVDYSTKHGWRFDLPDLGERVITPAVARADTVFFSTFVPRTNDPCELSEYGYKFAVDMLTGGSPEENVIDRNDDGIVDDGDYIDSSNAVTAAIKQDGYLPEPVFIEDFAFTGKTATKVKKLPDIPTGRFSWQELIR